MHTTRLAIETHSFSRSMLTQATGDAELQQDLQLEYRPRRESPWLSHTSDHVDVPTYPELMVALRDVNKISTGAIGTIGNGAIYARSWERIY